MWSSSVNKYILLDCGKNSKNSSYHNTATTKKTIETKDKLIAGNSDLCVHLCVFTWEELKYPISHVIWHVSQANKAQQMKWDNVDFIAYLSLSQIRANNMLDCIHSNIHSKGPHQLLENQTHKQPGSKELLVQHLFTEVIS